eukprot:10819672-Alexandrium_andersonii.AAC.1
MAWPPHCLVAQLVVGPVSSGQLFDRSSAPRARRLPPNARSCSVPGPGRRAQGSGKRAQGSWA